MFSVCENSKLLYVCFSILYLKKKLKIIGQSPLQTNLILCFIEISRGSYYFNDVFQKEIYGKKYICMYVYLKNCTFAISLTSMAFVTGKCFTVQAGWAYLWSMASVCM